MAGERHGRGMLCVNRPLYCHLWPARLYIILPHYLIKGTTLGEKVIENKSCFHFLYKFCLKHSSFQQEMRGILSQMYRVLHVKYRYSCHILMELEFSRQIFEKYSNTKFHENPSSGSRDVLCGRNFANAPKNDKRPR